MDAYRRASYTNGHVVRVMTPSSGFGGHHRTTWKVVPKEAYDNWAEEYESNFVGNLDQSEFDNMILTN